MVKSKQHPNRIFTLTKERRWKYADVAERVSNLARATGNDTKANTHVITINRLATGAITLTQEWMTILAEVFGVPAADIITAPPGQNLRHVTITTSVQAGHWRDPKTSSDAAELNITVPNDRAIKDLSLYAAEIRGTDNNLRYPAGSIVILSHLEGKPGEITEGKRYHVRATRHADGMVEDTIKMLVTGPLGKYWLKPESNHPEHQEWIPLIGREDIRIDIIGRVRGVFVVEE